MQHTKVPTIDIDKLKPMQIIAYQAKQRTGAKHEVTFKYRPFLVLNVNQDQKTHTLRNATLMPITHSKPGKSIYTAYNEPVPKEITPHLNSMLHTDCAQPSFFNAANVVIVKRKRFAKSKQPLYYGKLHPSTNLLFKLQQLIPLKAKQKILTANQYYHSHPPTSSKNYQHLAIYGKSLSDHDFANFLVTNDSTIKIKPTEFDKFQPRIQKITTSPKFTKTKKVQPNLNL